MEEDEDDATPFTDAPPAWVVVFCNVPLTSTASSTRGLADNAAPPLVLLAAAEAAEGTTLMPRSEDEVAGGVVELLANFSCRGDASTVADANKVGTPAPPRVLLQYVVSRDELGWFVAALLLAVGGCGRGIPIR